MHPFISNQISRIRSAFIISYLFHMVGSPAVPNIGSTIAIPWDLFSSSLPHTLLFIQTQLLFSPKKKIAYAKYVRELLFLVPLFTLHSVRCHVSLCVFPFGMETNIHSDPFTECCSLSKGWIHNWPTVFLRRLALMTKLSILKCFILKTFASAYG